MSNGNFASLIQELGSNEDKKAVVENWNKQHTVKVSANQMENPTKDMSKPSAKKDVADETLIDGDTDETNINKSSTSAAQKPIQTIAKLTKKQKKAQQYTQRAPTMFAGPGILGPVPTGAMHMGQFSVNAGVYPMHGGPMGGGYPIGHNPMLGHSMYPEHHMGSVLHMDPSRGPMMLYNEPNMGYQAQPVYNQYGGMPMGGAPYHPPHNPAPPPPPPSSVYEPQPPPPQVRPSGPPDYYPTSIETLKETKRAEEFLEQETMQFLYSLRPKRIIDCKGNDSSSPSSSTSSPDRSKSHHFNRERSTSSTPPRCVRIPPDSPSRRVELSPGPPPRRVQLSPDIPQRRVQMDDRDHRGAHTPPRRVVYESSPENTYRVVPSPPAEEPISDIPCIDQMLRGRPRKNDSRSNTSREGKSRESGSGGVRSKERERARSRDREAARERGNRGRERTAHHRISPLRRSPVRSPTRSVRRRSPERKDTQRGSHTLRGEKSSRSKHEIDSYGRKVSPLRDSKGKRHGARSRTPPTPRDDLRSEKMAALRGQPSKTEAPPIKGFDLDGIVASMLQENRGVDVYSQPPPPPPPRPAPTPPRGVQLPQRRVILSPEPARPVTRDLAAQACLPLVRGDRFMPVGGQPAPVDYTPLRSNRSCLPDITSGPEPPARNAVCLPPSFREPEFAVPVKVPVKIKHGFKEIAPFEKFLSKIYCANDVTSKDFDDERSVINEVLGPGRKCKGDVANLDDLREFDEPGHARSRKRSRSPVMSVYRDRSLTPPLKRATTQGYGKRNDGLSIQDLLRADEKERGGGGPSSVYGGEPSSVYGGGETASVYREQALASQLERKRKEALSIEQTTAKAIIEEQALELQRMREEKRILEEMLLSRNTKKKEEETVMIDSLNDKVEKRLKERESAVENDTRQQTAARPASPSGAFVSSNADFARSGLDLYGRRPAAETKKVDEFAELDKMAAIEGMYARRPQIFSDPEDMDIDESDHSDFEERYNNLMAREKSAKKPPSEANASHHSKDTNASHPSRSAESSAPPQAFKDIQLSAAQITQLSSVIQETVNKPGASESQAGKIGAELSAEQVAVISSALRKLTETQQATEAEKAVSEAGTRLSEEPEKQVAKGPEPPMYGPDGKLLNRKDRRKMKALIRDHGELGQELGMPTAGLQGSIPSQVSEELEEGEIQGASRKEKRKLRAKAIRKNKRLVIPKEGEMEQQVATDLPLQYNDPNTQQHPGPNFQQYQHQIMQQQQHNVHPQHQNMQVMQQHPHNMGPQQQFQMQQQQQFYHPSQQNQPTYFNINYAPPPVASPSVTVSPMFAKLIYPPSIRHWANDVKATMRHELHLTDDQIRTSDKSEYTLHQLMSPETLIGRSVQAQMVPVSPSREKWRDMLVALTEVLGKDTAMAVLSSNQNYLLRFFPDLTKAHLFDGELTTKSAKERLDQLSKRLKDQFNYFTVKTVPSPAPIWLNQPIIRPAGAGDNWAKKEDIKSGVSHLEWRRESESDVEDYELTEDEAVIVRTVFANEFKVPKSIIVKMKTASASILEVIQSYGIDLQLLKNGEILMAAKLLSPGGQIMTLIHEYLLPITLGTHLPNGCMGHLSVMLGHGMGHWNAWRMLAHHVKAILRDFKKTKRSWFMPNVQLENVLDMVRDLALILENPSGKLELKRQYLNQIPPVQEYLVEFCTEICDLIEKEFRVQPKKLLTERPSERLMNRLVAPNSKVGELVQSFFSPVSRKCHVDIGTPNRLARALSEFIGHYCAFSIVYANLKYLFGCYGDPKFAHLFEPNLDSASVVIMKKVLAGEGAKRLRLYKEEEANKPVMPEFMDTAQNEPESIQSEIDRFGAATVNCALTLRNKIQIRFKMDKDAIKAEPKEDAIIDELAQPTGEIAELVQAFLVPIERDFLMRGSKLNNLISCLGRRIGVNTASGLVYTNTLYILKRFKPNDNPPEMFSEDYTAELYIKDANSMEQRLAMLNSITADARHKARKEASRQKRDEILIDDGASDRMSVSVRSMRDESVRGERPGGSTYFGASAGTSHRRMLPKLMQMDVEAPSRGERDWNETGAQGEGSKPVNETKSYQQIKSFVMDVVAKIQSDLCLDLSLLRLSKGPDRYALPLIDTESTVGKLIQTHLIPVLPLRSHLKQMINALQQFIGQPVAEALVYNNLRCLVKLFGDCNKQYLFRDTMTPQKYQASLTYFDSVLEQWDNLILNRGMKPAHLQPKTTDNVPITTSPFQCFVCNAGFSRKQDYLVHMKSKEHDAEMERASAPEGKRGEAAKGTHAPKRKSADANTGNDKKFKMMPVLALKEDDKPSLYCPSCADVFPTTFEEHNSSMEHYERSCKKTWMCGPCDYKTFAEGVQFIRHCTTEEHKFNLETSKGQKNKCDMGFGHRKIVPKYSAGTKIGMEFVQTTMRLYCVVCRIYIPGTRDEISQHTKSLRHFQHYKMAMELWEAEQSVKEILTVAERVFLRNKVELPSLDDPMQKAIKAIDRDHDPADFAANEYFDAIGSKHDAIRIEDYDLESVQSENSDEFIQFNDSF